MGLWRARRRYGVSIQTLRRCLPFIRHRVRKAGSRTYVEIDTVSYESFAQTWLIGKYAKQPPAQDARYVSIWQAVFVSRIPANVIGTAVLREQIKAVRNPIGHWLLDTESFRAYVGRKQASRQARYLWLSPPSDREVSLVNELITRGYELFDQAQMHWMSTDELLDRLMAAIHHRERSRREYQEGEGV